MDLEDRIPARHPLHKIRQVANDALAGHGADFVQLYSAEGRPTIAPERLIRASLIQILGLGIDDPVWVATVFTKNRDRLLTTDMSRKFLAAILAHREVEPLLSDEHFSVDGTLVKAWASMKSFQPRQEGAPPDDDVPGDAPATRPGLRADRLQVLLDLRFHAERQYRTGRRSAARPSRR